MAKQDRAVRTRRELIRSAAEAFGRQGFATSSLSEISSGAGVSAGALNFHFHTKRELGEAVEEAAAEALRCIVASAPTGQSPPLQVLVDATHLLARGLEEDVVLRAGFGLGSDATWNVDSGAKLWLEWRSWVRGVLAAAGGEGNLAAGVVLEDADAAVTAAVVGFEVLGRGDARWRSRGAVTRFWDLMLPGLSSEAVRTELDAAGPGAPAWGEGCPCVLGAGAGEVCGRAGEGGGDSVGSGI
ncbi:ScbR family autoregulator-binding transcription factor [Streptomyces sp. NPDC088180]|uniref:ScbR family autoregulator-binding transcription factor n=1 Tax=Streptomyces sp. NPDC088180 TaxID=3365837 RepID=UPI00381900A5